MSNLDDKLRDSIITFAKRWSVKNQNHIANRDDVKGIADDVVALIQQTNIEARISELQQFKVPEQWKDYIKLSGHESCPICGFNSETARKFVYDRIDQLKENKQDE